MKLFKIAYRYCNMYFMSLISCKPSEYYFVVMNYFFLLLLLLFTYFNNEIDKCAKNLLIIMKSTFESFSEFLSRSLCSFHILTQNELHEIFICHDFNVKYVNKKPACKFRLASLFWQRNKMVLSIFFMHANMLTCIIKEDIHFEEFFFPFYSDKMKFACMTVIPF
jgi:hypothetical protein